MSEVVIRVENLSKKYIINHQNEGNLRNRSLSESVNNSMKRLANRLLFKSPRDKRYNSTHEDFWALKDISFDIQQGDRVGIIGRNGAGKSTLLKILSKITEPTNGRISIHGRVASLLEVGTGFHGELSGRENIFLNGAILGMSKLEIKHKFDEIVAFAEMDKFLDTPVKRYSSGMYVRLAFAVAAHLEPEILIVDEVLAVGDTAFQRKCLGKMEEVSIGGGKTVLFVSHNMATIKQLCNKGVLLERGELKTQGSMAHVMENYEKLIFGVTDQTLSPGTLYADFQDPGKSKFWISKIEILDENENPKPFLATWDYVKFRVHYIAREIVQKGSGVFEVTTLDNTKLLLCSTMPDRQVPMVIHKGEHYFDCIFSEWPLASGQYLIKAGLAIPMREWLCYTQESIPLTTEAKDVFNSGMPPDSSRYLFATSYEMKSEVINNEIFS
jgi:lipopolysaccharide transport system ATP-binding protein